MIQLFPKGFQLGGPCALLCLAICCSPAYTQQDNKALPKREAFQKSKENRVIGEYLVLIKEANQLEALKSHFALYEVTSVEKIEPTRFLVRIKTDPGVDAITKHAKKASFILEIQPNYIYSIN